MTRLQWDLPRTRTFEIGVSRGVLFPPTGPGVVWPGLVSIEEVHANIDIQEDYFDGRKYQTYASRPDFQARMTAYSAPPEFHPFDGNVAMYPGLYATHQVRSRFGLCFRTEIGNDLEGVEHGYKLHFIYNCLAMPSNLRHASTTESIDPALRRWTLHSIPYNKREWVWFTDTGDDFVEPQGTAFPPVSHLVVSSLSYSPEQMTLLEDVIYGTDTTNPEMPTPVEIIELVR